MPKTKIDLNDLTQAHLDEARAKLGMQTYRAPCIIGTLIPKEVREDPDFPQSAGINGERIKQFVEYPLEQFDDLTKLQDRFDSGDWYGVLEVAHKYIKEPVA